MLETPTAQQPPLSDLLTMMPMGFYLTTTTDNLFLPLVLVTSIQSGRSLCPLEPNVGQIHWRTYNPEQYQYVPTHLKNSNKLVSYN